MLGERLERPPIAAELIAEPAHRPVTLPVAFNHQISLVERIHRTDRPKDACGGRGSGWAESVPRKESGEDQRLGFHPGTESRMGDGLGVDQNRPVTGKDQIVDVGVPDLEDIEERQQLAGVAGSAPRGGLILSRRRGNPLNPAIAPLIEHRRCQPAKPTIAGLDPGDQVGPPSFGANRPGLVDH